MHKEYEDLCLAIIKYLNTITDEIADNQWFDFNISFKKLNDEEYGFRSPSVSALRKSPHV
jgi:hypothetical protein